MKWFYTRLATLPRNGLSRHRTPTDAGTLARLRARDVVFPYDVPVLDRLALRWLLTRNHKREHFGRSRHLSAVRWSGATGALLVAPHCAVPLQRALGALALCLNDIFLETRHLSVGEGASRICRFCFFVACGASTASTPMVYKALP